jgi:TRAP-type C4-dicarboxylate transport system permease small subunit
MQRYSRAASLIFGVLMLALAAAVTLETLVRKIFSISLGGVDELSGYAIAVGAPLAFAVALIERSHIRINIFYLRLGERTRGMLDSLAVVSLGALAIFLFIFTVITVRETQTYQSIAQTPWATPLIYPQFLWMLGMGAFLVSAVWLSMKAVLMMARGDWKGLTHLGGPGTIEEELKAELDDLKRR